jgi:tetratricopeptide (TPR) repeat protein
VPEEGSSADVVQTAQDIRALGMQVAAAYRMSDSARSAAGVFEDWQVRGPGLVGPVAVVEGDRDNRDRRNVAVRFLGELRTRESVPFLVEALNVGVDGDFLVKIAFAEEVVAALFRTESAEGHGHIRRLAQLSGPRSRVLENCGGSQSNWRWGWWNRFGKSQAQAERLSDAGADAFNRKDYVEAVLAHGGAVKAYPYFSGHWFLLAWSKRELSQAGSSQAVRAFARAWRVKEDSESEVREGLRVGAIQDLRMAQLLVPFAPSDLVDIGYEVAKCRDFRTAVEVYDEVLALVPKPEVRPVRAYALFRRAEASAALCKEKPELASSHAREARADYEESKQLHQQLDEQKGIVQYNLPYTYRELIEEAEKGISDLPAEASP